jgi:hypothetical protein
MKKNIHLSLFCFLALLGAGLCKPDAEMNKKADHLNKMVKPYELGDDAVTPEPMKDDIDKKDMDSLDISVVENLETNDVSKIENVDEKRIFFGRMYNCNSIILTV